MNQTSGRSVRLFLVDGSITGLVTAEVINWSGHVLSGSRSSLADFLKRSELDRTGVYILIGRDPDDSEQSMIYIGESDNVRKRLAQHNKDDAKNFWERTCVVTSKDQNITKAHARFLEARLISIASEVDRARLVNSTAQDPQSLPEADISDMEFFIEQIRLVLPVVGYNAFRAKPKRMIRSETNDTNVIVASEPITTFEIKANRSGITAEAQEIEGEFIVLAGSRAFASWRGKASQNSGYAKLHERLLQKSALVPDEGAELAIFAEDTPFSSPSAASAIIFGRADNGRMSWLVKGQNKTYAAWQEEKVDAAVG